MAKADVAAGLLGGLQCFADAVGNCAAHFIWPQLGDADARRDAKRPRAVAEFRVAHRFANSFGNWQRVVQRGLIEEHCKRIAAIAGDHIASAGKSFDNARGLAEDDVAALVPVFAVHQAEAIQIDQDDGGKRRAAALHRRALQLRFKSFAIGQRRQQVGVRQESPAFGRFLPDS